MLAREELAAYPQEEAEELALIYNARGLELPEARRFAATLLQKPEHALDTLAREELGLDPANLGSPTGAAISSFLAFASGALVPLLPFLVSPRGPAVQVAAVLAACGLLAVGASLSLFTGRNAILSALRMLLIGAAAAGATFFIGHLLGVSLA